MYFVSRSPNKSLHFAQTLDFYQARVLLFRNKCFSVDEKDVISGQNKAPLWPGRSQLLVRGGITRHRCERRGQRMANAVVYLL